MSQQCYVFWAVPGNLKSEYVQSWEKTNMTSIFILCRGFGPKESLVNTIFPSIWAVQQRKYTGSWNKIYHLLCLPSETCFTINCMSSVASLSPSTRILVVGLHNSALNTSLVPFSVSLSLSIFLTNWSWISSWVVYSFYTKLLWISMVFRIRMRWINVECYFWKKKLILYRSQFVWNEFTVLHKIGFKIQSFSCWVHVKIKFVYCSLVELFIVGDPWRENVEYD